MREDAMGEARIPESEYARITARVPIACVDLLAISETSKEQVGLINRPTYGGSSGWCLIGGAVLRNEPLREAVERHVRETLVYREVFDPSLLHLLDVFEYFTVRNLGTLYDPRKHAVSATFVGQLKGTPSVQNRSWDEASAFQWHDRERLRTLAFGFDQRAVVERYFESIGR